jgi:hypothetical protein
MCDLFAAKFAISGSCNFVVCSNALADSLIENSVGAVRLSEIFLSFSVAYFVDGVK